uniref:BHLH domain-containing protein n=1 Tax=Ditylenchus dipsaci TaxID=166011 RepID=A0A915D0V2_9BILA
MDSNESNNSEHGLRMTINFRERCRMHDLNEALDDLRKSIPYAHGQLSENYLKLLLYYWPKTTLLCRQMRFLNFRRQ